MDEAPAEITGSGETVTCPRCNETVEIDRDAGPAFCCPYCNDEFVVADDDAADEDETARRELERRDEEELDGLRIRKLATERRAAFRQRSYLIVVFGGCSVTSIQLLWMTYRHMRILHLGWGVEPLSYVLIAMACAGAAVWLGRIIRKMTRDLRAHTLAVAAANNAFEPDFSTLADGSDRWRNLHDVK
jgi:hypothetical protein